MGTKEILAPDLFLPVNLPNFRTTDQKVDYNSHLETEADYVKGQLKAWLDSIEKPSEETKAFYEAEIDATTDALKQHQVEIDASDWGQTVSVPSPDSPQQVCYGFSRVGAIVTFRTADQGETGEFLHCVFTYAGHEIDRLSDIFSDAKKIDFSASVDGDGRRIFGFSIGDDWPGTVFASVVSRGATDQVANPDLLGQAAALFPTLWTANHRQRGAAYVYMFLFYDPKQFQNGFPEITLEGYWKNDIWDPRDDSTGWSNNAALCFVNYLVDPKFGPGGYTLANFDIDNLIEAANICDELVDVAGGGTEKRYTFNGSFFASKSYSHNQVIEDFKKAFAGEAYEVDGVWRILPGAWRAPTITLTEKNLRSSVSLQIKPSKRDIFNGVRGKYRGPATSWEFTDYPPVKNSLYQAEDGEEIWLDLDFPFTTSAAACQRIAKIYLEDVRQWELLEADFDMTAYPLVPGDTVKISIDRFGYNEKIFEVLEAELRFKTDKNGPVILYHLLLKATASGIYDWNDGEETVIDLAPNTNLPDPSYVRPPTNIVCTSGTDELDIRSDGSVFSRIKIVWDQSTDVYVLTGGQHEIQLKKSTDSEYRTAGFVSGVESKFWALDIQDGTEYDIRVRAFTALGKSTWLEKLNFLAEGKSEPPSTVTGFMAKATNRGVEFSWEPISDLDVSHYEIRQGSSWATGTRIVLTDATSALWETQAAGNYHFWIRARDTSKNYSFDSAEAILGVSAPGPVRNLSATAIFNVIKITWLPPLTTTFPVGSYNIYRGTTFAGATFLGSVTATIKTIQEQISGVHNFWITPVDVHGNEGMETSVTVNISSLPFFELLYDQVLDPASALTLDYSVAENANLIAPVNKTETFEDHFLDNSFATPQAQVDAGYPLYIEPASDQTAVYVQKIDFGAVIDAAMISFLYYPTWLDGSGTITPQISYSVDDSTYTDVAGEQFAFGVNFRYVKVRLEITGDDLASIVKIEGLRVRLEVRTDTETVSVSALSTDGSGTLAVFTKDFLDIFEDKVQVSIKGSSANFATWTISGNDVRVFAWNTSGTRVSATVIVSVQGVVPA